MIYLSNTEIARKYRISNAAVTFWIQDAQEKKNNLEIALVKNKYRVIDNAHNHAELYRLSEHGKKFNRKRDRLEITPSEDFYKIFNEDEIVEIVRDLEVDDLINLKYSYKGVGAKLWDEFYVKSSAENIYKTPGRVEELLDSTFELIFTKIPQNLAINIVDIGCGNSHPLKKFIEKAIKIFNIEKYVAIDISQEMIEISKKNMNHWFPELPYFSYNLDIENNKFIKVFEEIKINSKNIESINLIFDLGGTIGNHKNLTEVLSNIQSGLRNKDIFIISNNIDIKDTKPLGKIQKTTLSNQRQLWDLETLGFDINSCEVEFRYDEINDLKVKSLVLNKDYILSIRNLGEEKILEFEKEQKIAFWKYKMTNSDKLFYELSKANLDLVAYNRSLDNCHALIITRIK